MKLHELQASQGSRDKHFRVGRGVGSGNGKTSGRGQKGQNSRTSGGTRLGFEGGQMPIYRRLPKRGFNNVNHHEYAVVNIALLNKFEDGSVVTPALLVENGLVRKEYNGIKVLGNGELSKKLTVQAHKFSKSAVAAIEAAGGKTEVI